MAPGHLVYIDDGVLMAAPFDMDDGVVTGAPVAISEGVGELSVSNDGKLLYASGNAGATRTQLMWVTREGLATPVDPNWTFDRGDVNSDWRISPDGSRVALREQTADGFDIWVKTLPDGPRSRLTFDPQHDASPRWSPDGGTIVYVSGSFSDSHLSSKAADGTGEAEVLLDVEESLAEAFWSPNGEWIILRTTTGAGNVFGRDIMAIRPGVDDEPVPLMATEPDEADPAVSPDGRWIAYTSNETGRFEVYVRPFPDVGTGRWQLSTQGGVRPMWGPGGREIYFRDGSRNMVVARVDGSGSAFRMEGTEVLFRIPPDIWAGGDVTISYDVTSDGQRFLMGGNVSASGDDNSPRFVLVRNFDEELRVRVPR